MLEDTLKKHLRIAAFGLRALPPDDGSAGCETFAEELYTRLANRGHEVTVYCRKYQSGSSTLPTSFRNLRLVHLRTTKRSGFDSLWHSFVCTFHIIVKNTGDVVHIHNGGNSIWAVPLRLCGKQVFVSQDGIDWSRDKWKWYARLFLWLSMYVTAYIPNATICDNVFARRLFETKFRRRYAFIPHGADLREPQNTDALEKYGLEAKGYLLFVGRFIPDKGIHYLIKAFECVTTERKLVIVGGSPNTDSKYEANIRETTDRRVQFLGFVYGEEVLQLMRGAYCYIQPSDIEGMSPVILSAMGAGTPLICSDIPENVYVVGDTALLFERSNVDSLRSQIELAMSNPHKLILLAQQAQHRARRLFSWDHVAESYETVFMAEQQISINSFGPD